MKKENMENVLSDVRDAYIQEAAQAVKGKNGKKNLKKWMAFPIAAALLVGLVMGVSAVTPVDLGSYLQEVFRISFRTLETTMSVPEDTVYHSSGEELKLELKGVSGDRQVLDAFVDVTLSPDFDLPEDRYFIHCQMKSTERNGVQSGRYSVLDRTENPDGSTTLSCQLTLTDTRIMPESEYAVECSRIEVWYEDTGEYTTILEGDWRLTFTPNLEDRTRVLQPMAEGNLFLHDASLLPGKIRDEDLMMVPAKVYEIQLSPVSIGVYWSVEAEYRNQVLGSIPSVFMVKLTDGRLIEYDRNVLYEPVLGRMERAADGTWHPAEESEKTPISITNQSSGTSAGGADAPCTGYSIFTFDAELPVEEIAVITVGEIVIPVE